MSSGQIPFAMGSVVYVEDGTFDGENIIHKADLGMFDNGSYSISYSTNRGAWVRHEDCTLLHTPTKESIRKLVTTLIRG